MWLRGYPEQALQRSQEALDVAQALSHPFSLAYALALAVILHQFRQEVEMAQEQAEALIALSTKQGFAFWLSFGIILRGWALVAQAQHEAGPAEIQHGLTANEATGAKQMLPYFQSLVAEAEGTMGHPEEALRVLTKALQMVKATAEPWWEAELHRRKGRLLLECAPENRADAETCFHQALAIAHCQKAKSLELRAAMGLSRLWQMQGQKREAFQLLTEVYE